MGFQPAAGDLPPQRVPFQLFDNEFAYGGSSPTTLVVANNHLQWLIPLAVGTSALAGTLGAAPAIAFARSEVMDHWQSQTALEQAPRRPVLSPAGDSISKRLNIF